MQILVTPHNLIDSNIKVRNEYEPVWESLIPELDAQNVEKKVFRISVLF